MKKFATILVLLIVSSAAIACSCKRTLIFGDVKRADLIFTGSVQSIERKYLVETYEYESRITYDTTFYYEFELRVKKAFKGKLKRNEMIIIKSTGGGADCGLYFDRNEKYLVYTSKTDFPFDPTINSKVEPYYNGSYCSRTKKSKRTWPHEWAYLLLTKIF